jgi:hypothetical protein
MLWAPQNLRTARPRRDRTFGGLALDEELEWRSAEPHCGLQVIDLATGNVVPWAHLEGLVSELYDIAVLPGLVRPMALALKPRKIEQVLTIEGAGTT